jgi:hypothetical protein
MGLDKDFLDIARSVQLEITGSDKNLLIEKHSNYNAKIFMDQCQICSEKAEETHHINEQNIADENGIINHFHKNLKHNLVPLCKNCHNKVTYGNLLIHGYIQTNEGIQLDYKYSEGGDTKKNSKKKFGSTDICKIKECWENTQTKRDCIMKLELNHNLKISQVTLNKILKYEY